MAYVFHAYVIPDPSRRKGWGKQQTQPPELTPNRDTSTVLIEGT